MYTHSACEIRVCFAEKFAQGLSLCCAHPDGLASQLSSVGFEQRAFGNRLRVDRSEPSVNAGLYTQTKTLACWPSSVSDLIFAWSFVAARVVCSDGRMHGLAKHVKRRLTHATLVELRAT